MPILVRHNAPLGADFVSRIPHQSCQTFLRTVLYLGLFLFNYFSFPFFFTRVTPTLQFEGSLAFSGFLLFLILSFPNKFLAYLFLTPHLLLRRFKQICLPYFFLSLWHWFVPGFWFIMVTEWWDRGVNIIERRFLFLIIPERRGA